MKRRKWPMKGWHKRYFVLDQGLLTYGTAPHNIEKGKIHGMVDVGLSVISNNRENLRIDIDAEQFIYHLKTKSAERFIEWVEELKKHQDYRQKILAANELTDESPTDSQASPAWIKTASSPTVTCWLLDNYSGLVKCKNDICKTQDKLAILTSLLEEIDGIKLTWTEDNSVNLISGSAGDLMVPEPLQKKKKKISLPRRRSKRSDSPNALASHLYDTPRRQSCHSVGADVLVGDQISSPSGNFTVIPSSSPNHGRSKSLSNEKKFHEMRCQQEFASTASIVFEELSAELEHLQTERLKLKQAIDQESAARLQGQTTINSLRASLSEVLKENNELRTRLKRIYNEADISDLDKLQDTSKYSTPTTASSSLPRPRCSSKSASDSRISLASISEFYDAQEALESIEDSSDDEIESDSESDQSEDVLNSTDEQLTPAVTSQRRATLPAPKPESGDFNLWSLLRQNIGKDLSRITMPVTLNEPLSALQKLCEELEYCELLETAAEKDDPLERMAYVAAFAVSGYSSSQYRCHKPFNPILGETYECIRDDKGFSFLAEQVSHHPPMSACHCQSGKFTFWQDTRIKTKFWGRSLEVFPEGMVHLVLSGRDEHYTWNKVTTCIHNVLKGDKWIELYGEVVIKNHSNNITCNLVFEKCSYMGHRNDVHGAIINEQGSTSLRLYGKWTEALYVTTHKSAMCLWKVGNMPENFEKYYGLTKFAIELNELDPENQHLLPPTDSRLRPDQRLLEEGKLEEAEERKLKIQQLQRSLRKERDQSGDVWTPRFFGRDAGGEGWRYNDKYWTVREDPGFTNIAHPTLW